MKFNVEDTGDRLSKIVIPIELNGVVLIGIVDIGAKYTLLSTYGAKKAKLFEKINRATRDKVKGIAGVSAIYGYLVDQAIYIESAKIE